MKMKLLLLLILTSPRQAYPAAEDASPAAVGKLFTEQICTRWESVISAFGSSSFRLFRANLRTRLRKEKTGQGKHFNMTWQFNRLNTSVLSRRHDCSLGWLMSSSLSFNQMRSSWKVLLHATVVVVLSWKRHKGKDKDGIGALIYSYSCLCFCIWLRAPLIKQTVSPGPDVKWHWERS